MSDYICPYTCSYRTNSGFCGNTGGWERCQYRQLRQPNTVVGYVPSLIKTNSDRIRSMTDEELLKALAYDRDQYDKGFRYGRRSAEVEAEWTEENTCSRCGEIACAGYDEKPWRTRYCPHCGAKMKNPEDYE